MKKRVFISGVTGIMGGAGLSHLLRYKNKIDIVILVRDSKKNRDIMKEYEESIDIVWGDLRNYEDVKKSIRGVDYILHIAALVSPKADYEPKKAWDINVGSVENILRAIDDLELYEVKLVYIASVAQTGCRLPPIHWGRVGDPIKPSKFDIYAVTKTAAERRVVESGLKYWVSLRQTGMLHYGLLDVRDGIIFHQPLNNVLEWISEEDSGRLLANLCTKDLGNEFWKNIYNIGGGEDCRMNNYDFTSALLKTLDIDDIREVFEPEWFASKNFHGQYYLDSDILNDYLDFRRESISDFIDRLKKEIKFPTSAMKYLPKCIIKNIIMKNVARSEHGPLRWLESEDKDKIDTFWGSLSNWENIKSWDDLNLDLAYDKVKVLDHGYDEEKDTSLLNIEDMKEAAKFRGGRCLSQTMEEGDLDTKLKWKCAFSHVFDASPRLVLKAGHWCEKCEAPPWNYEEIARKNQFFAQVWNNETY